ncbi:Atu4866 domain-containing protein [Streptomyces yaizuensis]|uniref:Atu4866 domain-containing protein n=1 Tax=Streptomyces yaizuensis TaxID=2989713 RepID=A0ABQ5NYX4_9ACTN|nr:Atu4866 domain-containing protein [Streptomyces sp. YSPA8]GLF95363.1 Atu4866 domain-containing protein [Streptomyces sp. YSPA8]
MSSTVVHPLRDAYAGAQLRDPQGRPLLLTGGSVITANPSMGDWQSADVLIHGSVIVGVGPGLLTAAEDDNMIVIDCAGAVVLPAAADFASPAPAATLSPGEPADIAVLRITDAPGTLQGAVPSRGSHLALLFIGGRLHLHNDHAPDTTAASPSPAVSSPAASSPAADHPHLGTWVDESGFIHQELRPDGRYDEARGDRRSAYRGRYWIDGTRIDYLDDLGFWAFGEFRDGVLHHAGYRFTRR